MLCAYHRLHLPPPRPAATNFAAETALPPPPTLRQVNRKLFVEFDAPRLINDFSSEDSVIHMVPSMQGPVAIESSQLRAPVGCHKQYMENMGVRGSLVSPVVVHYDGTDKKRLWGLVVCHNLKSHYVPYSTRSALSLLVRVFGTKVQQALEMEHTAYKHRASSAEVYAYAKPLLATQPSVTIGAPGSQAPG